MTEAEMLTSEEIEILEENEKGILPAKIAQRLGLPVEEVLKRIETARKKRERLHKLAEESTTSSYIRIVDSRVDVIQKGTMKVGSQVLKQLSEGIYTTPAASLKELISNSHDSDATEVTIDLDENEVSVKDNGQGMDWSDFDKEFTFISYSTKRLKGNLTPHLKRPTIGFIGIGFISVSELCDTLFIRSGKANSDIFFEATIDFSKFRRPDVFEKDFYEVSEYELVNYRREEKGIAKDKSFTEIKLKNLRPGFKEIVNDKKPFGQQKMTIERIWSFISEEGSGVTGLGRFWQMIFELASICPIKYSANSPVQNIENYILTQIRDEVESLNFRVRINGIDLAKPIVFPNSETILKSKEYAIHPIKDVIQTPEGELSFRGYVYSQHGMINPKECIGVVIRIKNVAVGGYDRTFLGYPSGSNQLFRNWLSGEIYVDKGLETAMNINRSTFKVANPDYIALQSWLHGFLDDVVFKYTLNEYYFGSRYKREEQKVTERDRTFVNIVKSEMGSSYKFSDDFGLEDYPVMIDEERRLVTINTAHPLFRRSPRKYETFLQQIFVLLEIAIKKSDGDVRKFRSLFREEVEKWINAQ